MRVFCNNCHCDYDDEFRTTVCPHQTFPANDGSNNFEYHDHSPIRRLYNPDRIQHPAGDSYDPNTMQWTPEELRKIEARSNPYERPTAFVTFPADDPEPAPVQYTALCIMCVVGSCFLAMMGWLIGWPPLVFVGGALAGSAIAAYLRAP